MPSLQQDAIPGEIQRIIVPDLGVGESRIRIVSWLTRPGSQVIRGERVAELLAGSVVFHLEASCDGCVKRLLVGTGANIRAGDAIAEVEVS